MIKKAFTLMEITVAMIFVGVISVLSIGSIQSPYKKIDIDKLSKANLNFKTVVGGLLEDNAYYSAKEGFKDLSVVRINDLKNDSTMYETKFRAIVFNKLEIAENNSSSVDCYTLIGKKQNKQSKCYPDDAGVYWSIPDTDFDKNGVLEVTNSLGSKSKFVPVTIYPNINKVTTNEEKFQKSAITIGVRYDGAMVYIDPLGVGSVDSEYCPGANNVNKSKYYCKFLER